MKLIKCLSTSKQGCIYRSKEYKLWLAIFESRSIGLTCTGCRGKDWHSGLEESEARCVHVPITVEKPLQCLSVSTRTVYT